MLQKAIDVLLGKINELAKERKEFHKARFLNKLSKPQQADKFKHLNGDYHFTSGTEWSDIKVFKESKATAGDNISQQLYHWKESGSYPVVLYEADGDAVNYAIVVFSTKSDCTENDWVTQLSTESPSWIPEINYNGVELFRACIAGQISALATALSATARAGHQYTNL